jgi:hypothetical protein
MKQPDVLGPAPKGNPTPSESSEPDGVGYDFPGAGITELMLKRWTLGSSSQKAFWLMNIWGSSIVSFFKPTEESLLARMPNRSTLTI